MINLIWAMDENWLVGKDDLIPWHIKEDLLYFKSKVKWKTVVMGDTTYFSLKGYYKNRPLPYGKIYVASLDSNLKLEDAEVINDFKSFIPNPFLGFTNKVPILEVYNDTLPNELANSLMLISSSSPYTTSLKSSLFGVTVALDEILNVVEKAAKPKVIAEIASTNATIDNIFICLCFSI